jgi:hypothetical protein
MRQREEVTVSFARHCRDKVLEAKRGEGKALKLQRS